MLVDCILPPANLVMTGLTCTRQASQVSTAASVVAPAAKMSRPAAVGHGMPAITRY